MTSDSYMQITWSEESFGYWLNREFISTELREQLSAANVLITPYPGYPDYEGPLFSHETYDFYNFLRTHAADEVVAQVCVEDQDFEYLSLNHDTLELPCAIVQLVVAPLFVKWVYQYIEYRLGSRKSNTFVKHDFTIEDPRTGVIVKNKYEGPASNYDDRVGSTIRLIQNGDDLKLLGESHDMDHEQRIARLSKRTDN